VASVDPQINETLRLVGNSSILRSKRFRAVQRVATSRGGPSSSYGNRPYAIAGVADAS